MKQIAHKLSFPYIAVLVAVCVYAALSLFVPADLSDSHGNIATLLSLVLLLAAVWFLAVYGVMQLTRYTALVSGTPEGGSFHRFSDGLQILAFSLIASGVLAGIDAAMIRLDEGSGWKIISEYIAVFLPLVAFYQIRSGSKKLVIQSHPRWFNYRRVLIAILVGLMAVFYVWAVFNNPYRNSSPDPDSIRSYYLPDPLIFLTVILPHVATWLFGGLAALNILAYQQRVKGSIYRKAFSYIGSGLAVIISVSVLSQFAAAVFPNLTGLSLDHVNGLTYFTLLATAVGYFYLARGARKLAKIEEVA